MKISRIIFCLLILTLVSLSSCNTKSDSERFVIDFDAKPEDELSLKFEDLVEKINIVKLETRDDLILSEYVRIELTDDYIITIGDDRIDQFDNKGNHIRMLTTKGRGPNEFVAITHLIDQKRDRLYLISYTGENKIMRIDLSTGDFLDNLKSEIPIWGKVLDDNGNIVGVSVSSRYSSQTLQQGDGTNAKIYLVDSENGTIKDIVVGGINIRNIIPDIIRDKKNMYYYDCIASDTLLVFDENGARPEMVFKISKKSESSIGEGVNISLLGKYGDNFILVKALNKVTTMTVGGEQYTMFATASQDYFYLDKNRELYSLMSFVIGRFNITLSMALFTEKLFNEGEITPYPLPTSSGDYLYYCLNAPNAIMLLERALEDETTTDKQRKEINALLSQIDEEDNHIIIYGKRK